MQTMTELPQNVADMVERRALAELVLEGTQRVRDMRAFLAVIQHSGIEYDSSKDRAYCHTLQNMLAIVEKVLRDVTHMGISQQGIVDIAAHIAEDWKNMLTVLPESLQNAAKCDMLSCTERIAKTIAG